MGAVRCPGCRGEISVDPADYGYPVACPLCGERFTPREPGATRPAGGEGTDPDDVREDDPAIERPSRGRRYEEEDDDYDRPSRRRHRRPPTLEDAQAIVAWPANGLIWTGVIGALLSLIVGAVFAVIGVFMLDDPQAKDSGWMFIIMGATGGVGGVPYFLALVLGGRQLKRLEGTWLVYIGAILGIATIIWCGVLMPTTWAGMTFGIWALVAVNRNEVREVMAAAAGDD